MQNVAAPASAPDVNFSIRGLFHIHCEHGPVGRLGAVLRVLLLQKRERAVALRAVVEHAGAGPRRRIHQRRLQSSS